MDLARYRCSESSNFLGATNTVAQECSRIRPFSAVLSFGRSAEWRPFCANSIRATYLPYFDSYRIGCSARGNRAVVGITGAALPDGRFPFVCLQLVKDTAFEMLIAEIPRGCRDYRPRDPRCARFYSRYAHPSSAREGLLFRAYNREVASLLRVLIALLAPFSHP